MYSVLLPINDQKRKQTLPRRYSESSCKLYGIGRCESHTPRAVLQARLLEKQEGANTKRYVFGKLSARCFQRRSFWHRHYSNCGDIEHGKSAQGGAIYTVPSYTDMRRLQYHPLQNSIFALPPP